MRSVEDASTDSNTYASSSNRNSSSSSSSNSSIDKIKFSLLKILAQPVLLRQWQLDGLPADDFSLENGLMATKGRRWPLMIDPQGIEHSTSSATNTLH